MLEIVGIIQARMSSQRCPGKVLRACNEKPLLGYLAARLASSKKMKKFILATSLDPSDDPIEIFAKKNNLSVFRGPLENVAARFAECAKAARADAFIRINGDSPWLDSEVVDAAIAIYEKEQPDVVTNIFRRSFPKGQSVEVVKTKTFLKAAERMTAPEEMEHATQFLYKNPDEYKISNFTAADGKDYSSVNLCVDSEADFRDFCEAVSSAGAKAADLRWPEVVDLYRKIKIHA